MLSPRKESSTDIVATPPRHLIGLPIFTSTDELIERSMQRMIDAPTPEALLADPESGGLRDHVGETMTITDVLGITPSALREGDYYVVFEALADRTGELLTLSTGSTFAAGRIAKLKLAGWLPRHVRVVELESTTNPGQASLWITDAPQVQGEPGEEPF